MKQISQITMMMLLLLLSIKLSAGTYSGGTGTSGDPYQIATLADLIELSTTTADWASTVYFIQTADIDATSTTTLNAGAGFSPIGNGTTSFQGYYDGQYHTITNLFINRSSTNLVGLFGSIDGAGEKILNIGLINVNITGGNNTGGLIGSILKGTISNCFTNGTVSGIDNVGGLAGSNGIFGNINSCYSASNVSGSNNIGGLVGFNVSMVIVSFCFSTGEVSGTDGVGGFAGYNSGTLNNCYSLGNVTRSSGTNTKFGGFCGESIIAMAGGINRCYSTGSVNFGTDKGFIGLKSGLGGYINNFFDQTTSGQTTGTGATGKTTAEMKTQSTFTNWDFTAGINNWAMSSPITYAGYPTLQWTGGYSVAPVNTPKEIASLPNLVWIAEAYSISPTVPGRWSSGYVQTANIISWTTPSWDGNKGWTPIGNASNNFTGTYDGQNNIISNIFSNRTTDYIGFFGIVSGRGEKTKNIGLINVNISGGNYTGALAGKLLYNTATNCYSSGKVTGSWRTGGLIGVSDMTSISNCNSNGKVSGTSSVGGLVGHFESSVLSNCYSNANVIATDENSYAGGLIGFCYYSSSSNCYAKGNVEGKTGVGGFVGKTEDVGITISSCFSTGNVRGVSKTGGFVGIHGSNYVINITNCYSLGNVTRISGTDTQFGGFCGYCHGTANISNCYSVGFINFGTSQGFIGTSFGTASNNYFDATTSGQTSGYGATAKTTAEMKTQSTFTSWNFTPTTGVWKIQSGSYLSYPYLQSFTYDAPGASPAVNPIPGLELGLPDNPTSFAATAASSTQIDVSWTLNGNGNDVVLAFNSSSTFGTPTGTYTAGDPITGGGTVLYAGNNTSFNHTSLSVNTHYYYKIWSTDGTDYSGGATDDEWTLANVPSAPTVNNPTSTSLDVAVNVNGNPAGTEFAIHETSTNKFVQANGTLGASAVWATAATWGNKTVTGLTTGSTYTFEVKARNGENTETAYGASASGNTCSNPTNGGEIGSNQTICAGGTPDAFTSISGASNYGGTLEYKWQVSTTSGVAGFTDVASSNSATYSPGALTQATWYKRLARVDCKSDWTGAAESNVVKISIEPTPVSGSLTKSPDVANVCEGTDVSATLTAGSGGNGTDVLEYRTHNGTTWSSWATYISGTDISTTDKTQVEIQTLRQADYCSDAAASTVSWTVDPSTVAGGIGGSSSITYGSSTGNLTLTGYTGAIQKWQKRQGTSGGWTDISNTTATFSETPASAGTWEYSVLVQSGTCDDERAEPHEITVEPKELTISGSFTANDKIYDDNTDATFDDNSLELTGIVGTDDVYLTGLEIDFASKTVGEHTITITAANLAGADKDNYTLTLAGSPETTATINAGPPVKFLVTNPEGGDITSPKLHNIPFNVKVTLVDAYDNPTPNTGGNVTITLTGSGGATPGDLRFQGFPVDPVTQTLSAGDTISDFDNVLYTGVSAVAGFDVKVSATAAGTGTGNGKTGESNLFSVRDIFFSVEADPTAILADGTSKSDITVTLEDHDNNPLANQAITVETDKGTLMEGAVELSGVVSRNTDANGQVFLQLRSDNVSALATVTAKCPGACPQTVQVAFILNAPVITGFTPGEEQVTINFNPPTNTGLTTISNYEYSLNDGTDWTAFSPAQTGSPVTITGLTGGQTYPAKLRAVNEVGTGAASESEEVYSCFNPTDGGEIGSDQTINNCETPVALTSITPASGFFGTLEYQWQSSTTSDTESFTNIEGATSSAYQPEALNDTTWFRRLARVSCKPDWTEAVSSNVVKITVKFVQTIQIPQGWSYISSWLQPNNPNIVNMWADIVGANNLAILTGTNGIYAPAPFYINTLNNWDVKKGYKVKMNAADELQVNGVPLNENIVNFSAGAHLIPVLTNQTTGLDEVFNDPANDILYMLDLYQNRVYWPGGALYTLTELVPGTGYLANFKNPVTLTYPPLGDCSKSKSQSLPPAEGPWPVVPTSNFHLISVSVEALNDLQNTDYIGAFDSQGNCVGYAEFEKTGQNILLTIYGDEPITAENDGMLEGEILRFRSFNISENTEKELSATFNSTFPNVDGLFYANGLSGITGFKESATGLGENDLAASVLVYPNPAKDVVNINLTVHETSVPSGLEATLITADGKRVKTFTITSQLTKIDVGDLPQGIYILQIRSFSGIITKQLVIQ